MSKLVGREPNEPRLGRWAPLALPAGLAICSAVALIGLVASSSRADDPILRRTECEVVTAAAASLSPNERAGTEVILTRIGDPEGVMPFKPLDLPARVNREVIDCAPVMTSALHGRALSAGTGLVSSVRFGRVALAPDGASAQVVVQLHGAGRLLTLERQGGEWRRVASQELWRE